MRTNDIKEAVKVALENQIDNSTILFQHVQVFLAMKIIKQRRLF